MHKLRQFSALYGGQLFAWLLFFLLPTQLGLHLWPTWAYIEGMRVDYLAPTLTLGDVLLGAVLLYFWKTRRLLTARTPRARRTILLIVSGIVCNVAFSMLPLLTLLKWIKIVIAGWLFVSILNEKNCQRAVVLGLVSTSCVQLTLVLQQFFTQGAIQGGWYWLGERAIYPWMPDIAQLSINGTQFMRPYGTFSHPNAMGGFFLVAHFLLWYIQHKSHSTGKYWSLLCVLGTFTSSLLVYISFSKAAIGTFTLIHILLVFRDPAYRWCRLCLVARPLMLIVVCLIFLQGQGDLYSVEKRWTLLSHAIQLIPQHLVTGTGLGTSVMTMAGTYFHAIPLYQPVHQIGVLWFAETGLVGMVVVIYLIRIYSNRFDRSWGALAPLVAVVLTGLGDHYWLTQSQNIYLLLLVIAWHLSLHDSQNDGKMLG